MKLERKCLIVFSTILLVICFVAITKTYGTIYYCSKPVSNGTKCEPFTGDNWVLVNNICIGNYIDSGCEENSKKCSFSLTSNCIDSTVDCGGTYQWRDVDEYEYSPGKWTCVPYGSTSSGTCGGTYLWANYY